MLCRMCFVIAIGSFTAATPASATLLTNESAPSKLDLVQDARVLRQIEETCPVIVMAWSEMCVPVRFSDVQPGNEIKSDKNVDTYLISEELLDTRSFDANQRTIPEPSTVTLVSLGFALIACLRRRGSEGDD